MQKTALITGVTGQDGSYLTELLLSKNYKVHGLVRRSSNTIRERLDHLTGDASIYNQSLFLHYADLGDSTTLRRLLQHIQPAEIYHLAGQSHVGASFDIPESTCEFTAMGTLRLLEILRDMSPRPKLLHVSSSEIFGRPVTSPQNEQTLFDPATPYGVAKAFATQMVRLYRESHGFFACNAICYNHESPRRGESFVTRKITRTAAAIKLGLAKEIRLGDISARRDWGFAGDYVDAMWRILQQDKPSDFVLATGKTHTVEEFLAAAFSSLDLDWKQYYKRDERFVRPIEVTHLCGDPTLAEQKLGWTAKTKFADLVASMVQSDLADQR